MYNTVLLTVIVLPCTLSPLTPYWAPGGQQRHPRVPLHTVPWESYMHHHADHAPIDRVHVCGVGGVCVWGGGTGWGLSVLVTSTT